MSFARASARRITKRGSPSYGSPPGFRTSQNTRPTLWVSPVRQGRILNVLASGMAIMSDSSIRLKPVIEEPSKPMPSSSASGSSSRPTANDFSWPKMSVNQNRMNSTFSSSTRASTSAARVPTSSGAIAIDAHLLFVGLEDELALLARANPNGLLDGQHEQLPVADGAGAGVPQDDLLDGPGVLALHDALELELRAQVDGELRAAVVLGDRLLPAGALHLGDREAGEAGLEQVRADRLERLVADVGDDHLHAVASPVRPTGAVRGACAWPSGGPPARPPES